MNDLKLGGKPITTEEVEASGWMQVYKVPCAGCGKIHKFTGCVGYQGEDFTIICRECSPQ